MGSTNNGLTGVGKFLRRLRFEHEESQEEMANRLGVTAPYISMLGGKQPVTKKLALKIIKEYNLQGDTKASFVDVVTRDVVRRFWGGKV
jgi:transcriptional regulator with XRE-family HTH domain